MEPDRTQDEGIYFECPRCRMRSHNPNDVVHAYCRNCHDFWPQSTVDPAASAAARRLLAGAHPPGQGGGQAAVSPADPPRSETT